MGFIFDSRVPSATTTTSAQEQGGHRELTQFSVLHIVLIAVGGVVFFVGIIIIIVLLKSRKKFCANNTNPNGRNSRQSPIFVVGQGTRQGRGGDNPAFCRADEGNNGGLPCSRIGAASPSRLPSYDEVVSGRVPTAPVSRSPPRSNSQASDPHPNPQPPQQQQQAREATRHDPEVAPGGSRTATPPPRYAYDYPSCYWEEVPPPPYSAGNCGVVRAMGGPRGPATTQRRESTRREAVAVAGRNNSPNPGRAPLAVPTPTVLSPAQSPALPLRHHTLTSSGRAVPPTTAHPSAPLPTLVSTESTRPLASSSPAVPRRQPTPAAAPVAGQLPEYLLSVGGVQNCTPLAVLERSRAEVTRGQGHCYGNVRPSPSRATYPSAPIARFDIEL